MGQYPSRQFLCLSITDFYIARLGGRHGVGTPVFRAAFFNLIRQFRLGLGGALVQFRNGLERRPLTSLSTA